MTAGAAAGAQPPVVIPAYNEAATIRDVVERALSPRASGGSSSTTARPTHTVACLAGLPRRLMPATSRNLGQGRLSGGFAGRAREAPGAASGVVTMDGDGQHDPGRSAARSSPPRRCARTRSSSARGCTRASRCRAALLRQPLRRLLDRRGRRDGRLPTRSPGSAITPATVFATLGLPHDRRAASFVLESEVLIAAARAGIDGRVRADLRCAMRPRARASHSASGVRHRTHRRMIVGRAGSAAASIRLVSAAGARRRRSPRHGVRDASPVYAREP